MYKVCKGLLISLTRQRVEEGAYLKQGMNGTTTLFIIIISLDAFQVVVIICIALTKI